VPSIGFASLHPIFTDEFGRASFSNQPYGGVTEETIFDSFTIATGEDLRHLNSFNGDARNILDFAFTRAHLPVLKVRTIQSNVRGTNLQQVALLNVSPKLPRLWLLNDLHRIDPKHQRGT
jgi:hypothetical protein